jgi:hypothetical protein
LFRAAIHTEKAIHPDAAQFYRRSDSPHQHGLPAITVGTAGRQANRPIHIASHDSSGLLQVPRRRFDALNHPEQLNRGPAAADAAPPQTASHS